MMKVEDFKTKTTYFMGLVKESYEFKNDQGVWLKLLEKEVKVGEGKCELEHLVVHGEIEDGKMRHFEKKEEKWGITK